MSHVIAAVHAGFGWRRQSPAPSLPESHRSVPVFATSGFWRKLLAFAGPGYLVAVGYMDPGNWATSLAGGSAFGYTLLSVILLSNLMAMVLQFLSAKLGIATGRDLAQACRDNFSPPVALALWALCELAIIACDLAELIGTAIALNLLFGLPLIWGVVLTSLDVLLILLLQTRNFRHLEAFVLALMITIAASFAFVLALAKPALGEVLAGFVPQPQIVWNPEMLYVAIGILGATVMPHNLYLHSSIVQTRRYALTDTGKREAVRFAAIDSTVALTFALAISAAILIVAATVFHAQGHTQVAEIDEAYKLLAPLLGAPLASIVFAVALLASGQNSAITGTLAGQIVMDGFLNLRLPPWLRRLVTRLAAIVPVVIVTLLYGEGATTKLLVLSQVILSLQLPFAVIPLVRFTSDRAKMGNFVNSRTLTIVAWTIAAVIVVLNVKLLADVIMG
jgi:manganese transport protein